MINILTNRQDPVFIGSLELEATISENHEFTNEITDYPVENGYDISDHVRKKPETISIEGLFSRDPVPLRGGSLEFYIKGAGQDRIQSALEQLMLIVGRTIPKQVGTTIIVEPAGPPRIVDIISTIRIYTTMICTNLTIPVSPLTGQSLRFNASFKKIETVSSKIVSIDNSDDLNGKAPNVKEQAPKTKDAGNQTKKDVPEDSQLYRLVGKDAEKLKEKVERFFGL